MKAVQDRHLLCLWYAWGRIDTPEYGDLFSTNDGYEFAKEQEVMMREFMEGLRTTKMPSVTDSWDEYVERKVSAKLKTLVAA